MDVRCPRRQKWIAKHQGGKAHGKIYLDVAGQIFILCPSRYRIFSLKGIALKSRTRKKSQSGAQCQPCASWIKAIDASLPGGMGRAVEPEPSLMQGKRQVVQGS
jgi:hypothetical protein